MPGSVRVALIAGALVLAGSAATLRTTASPLQGPALSRSHKADQDAASRAKPISARNIFRFDTFDDEQLWTNVLRMHEAVRSVNPVPALSVGLKVDVDALPTALIEALQAGQVDLTDPAVTTELLRLNAVVGVIGKVDDLGHKAGCATCHKPPTYTDVLSGPDPSVPVLHDPVEVGTEASYAAQSATGKYRTSPVRGIWQHPPYFHDGSAADLLAVVNHYDALFKVNLSAQQKTDLVEFLKSRSCMLVA
jgi:hypothetical protein